MRPIDADRLKETIKKLDVESPDIKTARIISQTIQEIFPQIIDDEPTIEAEPVNGWISVKDRLPENKNQVMVYGLVDSIFQYGVKDEIYIIGRYKKDYHSWWFPVKIDLKVTHWQPLPKPPKGE